MIPYNKLKDVRPQPVYKRAVDGLCRAYSDVIYTFDIETTSAYLIDGTWQPFDRTQPPEFYKDKEKAAWMYIGMLGIEDHVYYFRKWDQFNRMLQKISNPHITKIIFVHNLSWEMQFLRNIIQKYDYTVSHMIAREIRKPICFHIDELNIDFRCSYCLTNLKLETAAKKYNKVYFKKAGDLDYNVIRTCETVLDEEEEGYCEGDLTSLYEIIYHFREEYKHVERIPLTQTGEVRRAFKLYTSPFYKEDVKKLIPASGDFFLLLMGAFSGGLTHSNYIRTGKVYKNVISKDLSSSYPAALMRKYPMTRFRKIREEDLIFYNKGSFALLYCVRFENIKCQYLNAYIPAFKCRKLEGAVCDNGRVISASICEIIITDIDMDIIQSSYEIGDIIYLSIYASKYKYLPKQFISFMLELYKGKTELKKVKGQEAYYAKMKERLNALYGCCTTNVIRQDIDFTDNQWTPHKELTVAYVEEKLEKQRESRSNLFAYQWGVWCTAYARKSLYLTLTGRDQEFNQIDASMDFDVLYYDTDSIKFINPDKHAAVFDKYNDYIYNELMETVKHYKMDPQLLSPVDKNGEKHYLGVFETDGEYLEFKTEGSKRYSYRDKEDGKLHSTIAGVNSKTGVNALNDDINNFHKGLVFDYDTSGKLMSVYLDDQKPIMVTDVQGHQTKIDEVFGICLMPTTYTLKVDSFYDMLLQWARKASNMSEEIQRRIGE